MATGTRNLDAEGLGALRGARGTQLTDEAASDIKSIDEKAKVSSTSILLELGKEINREELLKLIIQNFDPAIQKQECL